MGGCADVGTWDTETGTTRRLSISNVVPGTIHVQITGEGIESTVKDGVALHQQNPIQAESVVAAPDGGPSGYLIITFAQSIAGLVHELPGALPMTAGAITLTPDNIAAPVAWDFYGAGNTVGQAMSGRIISVGLNVTGIAPGGTENVGVTINRTGILPTVGSVTLVGN
jgi:hypothetical protein